MVGSVEGTGRLKNLCVLMMRSANRARRARVSNFNGTDRQVYVSARSLVTLIKKLNNVVDDEHSYYFVGGHNFHKSSNLVPKHNNTCPANQQLNPLTAFSRKKLWLDFHHLLREDLSK
jgi:hypothetical protein